MRTLRYRELALLLALTLVAVATNGYHLGQQDQAIYLPAIKKNLDPGLYTYDSDFFYSQTRWTLFDEFVSTSTRLTQLPLDTVIFLFHLAAIFAFLLACRRLAERCFLSPAVQWAAVVTVAVVMLMPIAGTQLQLMERYLHPRNLATPALLFALVAALDRKPSAFVWLALAGLFHPTMALLGAVHLLAIVWKPEWTPALAIPSTGFGMLLVLPEPNAAWRDVLATRPYLYPLQWHWYEWLGIVAPMAFLLWFVGRRPRASTDSAELIGRRLLASTIAGMGAAITISSLRPLESLVPTEPMRILHLTSIVFVLFAGGTLFSVLEKRRAGAVVLMMALSLGMYEAHRLEYNASPHIAWPGRVPENDWVQSFDWARRHTPRDALFALDPRHMQEASQDSHGFRAFAERSMMADWVKDRAVSALTPELAYEWQKEVSAREGWDSFTAGDFQRLKRDYGVQWIIWEQPSLAGLDCPYRNATVRVCRIL